MGTGAGAGETFLAMEKSCTSLRSRGADRSTGCEEDCEGLGGGGR